MSAFGYFLKKQSVVVLSAAVAALGCASVAQAADLQYEITNQSGSTMYLDGESCTNGSVSAPYSIANGRTETFTVSSSGSTDMCTVKYESGASSQYGCRFVLQTSSVGGFAMANSYKGTAGKPKCSVPNEVSTGPSSYYGKFIFSLQ